MTEPRLTLYVDRHFHSPYAMSVFVALTEKGLPFTLSTVDLDAGQEKLAPYRDFALTARVPALEHDGFVLSESSAIVEYLDEQFPSPDYAPLLPAEPRQRARARQVQAWLRSDLAPLRAERDTRVVFVGPVDQPLSEDARAAAAKLIRVADSLIDGPHLFGAWCIADTDLALMLQRLIRNGDPVPAKLQTYAAGQWQRDAVQQWLQPR